MIEGIGDVISEHLGSMGMNFKGIVKEFDVSENKCNVEVEVEHPDSSLEIKFFEIDNIHSDDISIEELF